MMVEILRDKGRVGLKIIPETDFEVDYLSRCFVGNDKRSVIVKSSPRSLSDVESVIVFTEVAE